jgi:DNA-binding XRE family transcriptional regulator
LSDRYPGFRQLTLTYEGLRGSLNVTKRRKRMKKRNESLFRQQDVDIDMLKKAVFECERRLLSPGSPENYDLQSREFIIEVGHSFKTIRKVLGYSQEELGGLIGIQQNRISLLEQGKTRIRLEEACKYKMLIMSFQQEGITNALKSNPMALNRKFEEACICLNPDGLQVLEDAIDMLKKCSCLKRLP